MPTIKQQVAAQKAVENHGNISQAMLAAGYDPTSAKNPKNLTESKGWQELMKDYLPDELLLKVHTEGLEATKVVSALIIGNPKDANSKTTDFIDVPDHPTRHKYLETAYKIKDKLKENINATQINVNDLKIEFTTD